MDFSNIFQPITYNSNVNGFLADYNMRFMDPIGPIYNFGGGNSTNWNGGSSSIWSGYLDNNSGWNSFDSGYIVGNPFSNFGYTPFNFGPIYNFGGSSNYDSSTATSVTTSTPTAETSQSNTSKSVEASQSSNYINRSFVKNAEKYLGYKESDGSYRKFSNSKEWCADFVTYVVKETYKDKGLKAPDGFGNHRVEILRQWGIDNDKYLKISDKKDKAKIIAENVKPGNILILRENDASHTGFVTKVNSDGSFDTIEGNVTSNGDDRVIKRHYSANEADLSGFVQLS